MSTTDWPQSLRSFDLFSECTDHQLERIGSLLTTLREPAGQRLIKVDTPGFEFIFILEGEVEVVIDPERAPIVLGPGQFVGEMSLLTHHNRTATVLTRTPATVAVASVREFSSILDAAPSVQAKIAAIAAEREASNRG